jgi:oligoendopeptidase F
MGVVERKARNYLPAEFEPNEWSDLAPYYEALIARELDDLQALQKWLRDVSELEAFVEEEGAWRYIRMTIDTNDAEAEERYKRFITDFHPPIASCTNALNRKLAEHPDTPSLKEPGYRIYLRSVKNAIRLFREQNVPLETELRALAQQYSAITGKMEIKLDGESLTLQAAAAVLRETNRNRRQQAYEAVLSERMRFTEALESVFDRMVALRNEVARNADYPDYRSYMFASMGRFDYTIQDCIRFHQSIEEAIVPLARESVLRRKKALGVAELRPYDLQVDPIGRSPLSPFQQPEELLTKSIAVFERLDPFFGDCLREMAQEGYLDLGSKKGKAPGGYNYPLYESGLPFIFMNAVGTQRDMVTMMHEGGHAVHSVLSHPLPLTAFKGCPSEVAELASMTMELLSMDHWHLFYPDADDCIRAKREHLEDLLTTLPWIARIDAFQHWIYTNPNHTREERKQYWVSLGERFDTGAVDFSGYEDALTYGWHKQLHLFEVPFYYIEYAIAQLGAVAVWRNYKRDPEKALADFKSALALGYTQTISEIYQTAGIRFDFSPVYLKELAQFVQDELSGLS